MTTLSQAVPQQDIVIHRGADEEFFVRWEEDRQDGEGYKPKDLTNWSAVFSLEHAGRKVYEVPCMTDCYGYSIAQIPGITFMDSEWQGRPLGSWRMDGFGPDGERELLGWGHYEMV